jgi:pyruvate dehydrogenase (quinone)
MSMRVADALVETAVPAGVERVYGVIGDSLNPIGDAIRRKGTLRWVHVRHEEACAFAAGAEAQLNTPSARYRQLVPVPHSSPARLCGR